MNSGRQNGRLVLAWLLALSLMVLVAGCGSEPLLETPRVDVSGGFLVDASPDLVRIRAQGPSLNIALAVPAETPPGKVELAVENVNGESTDIEGDGISKIRRTPTTVSCYVDVRGDRDSVVKLNESTPAADWCFLVVGDTQGKGAVLSALPEAIAAHHPRFIVFCGDLTTTGNEQEYVTFNKWLEPIKVPIYTVPGNHDIVTTGGEAYRKRFGTSNSSFAYGDLQFIFLDTSAQTLDSDTAAWLKSLLSEPSVVFTHVPPFDPTGTDHCLDPSGQRSLQQALEGKQDVTVFTGHIHMFHEAEKNGIHYVITGGGGARPYAPPDEGGYHHYTLVKVHGKDLTIKPVPVTSPPSPLELSVFNGEAEAVFSIVDLQGLTTAAGKSRYQNRFNNYQGDGEYRGVRVSDILAAVGGMKPGERLRVRAADGYELVYDYANIYPTGELLERQGEMVLAYSCNGQAVPDWPDGYRIAFLPEDGTYDNADCAATAPKTALPATGEGLSAGSMWVRNVAEMEVIR